MQHSVTFVHYHICQTGLAETDAALLHSFFCLETVNKGPALDTSVDVQGKNFLSPNQAICERDKMLSPISAALHCYLGNGRL